MLRPEEREDRQLETVRLALEQLDDPRELGVRQAERAMERKRVERLFGDRAQGASVTAGSDGFGARADPALPVAEANGAAPRCESL